MLGATEQTDFRFEEPAVDCGCPVEWQYVPGENGWNVVIYPGKSPVKYLKLRWHGDLARVESVLGDEWGRISATHAPVEWRSVMPFRPLPWFCIARAGETTLCYGVKTGCDCFAFFQLDCHGVTLFLNLMCGAAGTDVKVPFTACVVTETVSTAEESVYDTAKRFMHMLCEKPVLPKTPVFGVNNWYWAYGSICDEGVLREADYPYLKNHAGKHLIVTDGTTLLGADDKAGVAEIMTAAQQLLTMGGRHATLKIGFTPDEEIGRGADRFDVKGFGADFAYTADGGPVGEIEYENFNAAGAKVVVHGLNIHPGSAKGKMVNSQLIAMEFQSLLPVGQRPELTEGYEGFFHLLGMKGEVERSELHYIIRDHDMEKFEEKKAVMTAAADFINRKYGAGTLELTLKDSYYNMKKCIEPCMYVVERAKKAMAAAGMNPVEVPIRGGTDGARLSYEGLPCPNLCTGGENYHGRFEFIPTEDMEKCVRMLVEILTA